MQEGLQQSLQQGSQQRLQQGLEEAAGKYLTKVLKKRLGFLSSEAEERIKSFFLRELDELAEKIFEVTSGSDLRKFLGVEH
ncbi:protein of unknown function [Thermanaeromonas toyohensis ToBE]|uniref:DUF4351 domain-containing protein n=1 Tax=Thermanaeromonas toyohensis ToBE TaxID=698762 RepID=A0A1W1VUB6_9FIRM|nr:DUF4351 domain-containing protein [Thermanaeromonas toyohensis]SMB96701.1 protein of unknown function [Thermanaeromonas toyohensis ToBE]